MGNLIASSVDIHKLALQVLSFRKCNAVNQKVNIAKFIVNLLEK